MKNEKGEGKTSLSYPTQLPREHPSAYIVQDLDNLEEMTRLEIQDKMLTTGMGGVLPEQADPTSLRKVLDVGCGTGGWLMETAQTYPMIERLVGVDVSSQMLAYARSQAQAQHLDGRTHFQTMDALRVLQFSGSSFDLVNQRLGVSWLRIWEWKKILLEYQRVCRPGGVIRITEPDLPECNSPALTALWDISLKAFHHSGRFFAPRNEGITGELVRLMTRHAIEDVRTQVHILEFRTGTVEHSHFAQDVAIANRVALPFYQRWTRVPENYQQMYRQALEEMQEPGFVAKWRVLTVWGTKPMYGGPLMMRGLL